MLPVKRSVLPRGFSMAPAGSITVGAVLEHAVRHLAWLSREDPAVSTVLVDWSEALKGYLPEPFQH